MKKNAFTIPELMIFMTIVGVISVFMMSIIKPGEKYVPYAYYNAYEALSSAAYNIKEDATDLSIADTEGTEKPEDKVFPGAKANTENDAECIAAARELCKKLAVDPTGSDEDVDKYGYINSTIYNCSSFTPTNKTGGFADKVEKPAFQATNSMIFYISQLDKIDVPDALNSNVRQSVKYFIVWVDINGDRKPNTALWSEKRTADIVPFIVTTSGNVLPAGAPIIDTRYMTAKVAYMTEHKTKYSIKTVPFYEAQIMAYDSNEFPSYDLLSLKSSLLTKFKTTLYSTSQSQITAIDDRAALDENCPITANEPPSCSVIVNENKRL